ncbi:MAG: serine hydrolase [Pseudomonadota bacterium]
MERPSNIDLSNWRQPPGNRWSFQNVPKIVASESLQAAPVASALVNASKLLDQIRFNGADDTEWTLSDLMIRSSADAFCVAHEGELIHEWYAPHYDPENPHIVFSVSKSISALLAGPVVESGKLDVNAEVCRYIPELEGSVYADCSVQHVLDMTVSTTFEEDYTSEDCDFVQYRKATGWHPMRDGETSMGLHAYLATLKKGQDPHGLRFRYRSPNSDLLGWIIERAAGESLVGLLQNGLWTPMGAENAGVISVDPFGAPRSAGGICATARDLVRIGEIMCNRGNYNGQQIIPEFWVDDCIENGDVEAWKRGDFCLFLPSGRYRNKWYRTNASTRAISAIGIHGQWIYVDPDKSLVVAKLSSQPVPVDEPMDVATLRAFEAIGDALN